MHKILFKAKLKNWKENPKENLWVEGSLLVLDWESDYVFIMKEVNHASTLPIPLLIERNCFLVDKETICRYTGKEDIKKQKIYTGDIINSFARGKYVVCMSDFKIRAVPVIGKKTNVMSSTAWGNTEIVGNIYDDQDILKGEEKQ